MIGCEIAVTNFVLGYSRPLRSRERETDQQYVRPLLSVDGVDNAMFLPHPLTIK